ncbi:hypothetical protein SAMN04488128_106250 [Chitinophaga eiseniae]|uniref:Uncharacterized protein n=1 Tax=Chitinophaga eiseniae TaxID=634771 RepID=A0A1T4TTJ8_9BACT|nr:hypothetical protein SAMN04488128_106250 [Chitinophaga eiseniae]
MEIYNIRHQDDIINFSLSCYCKEYRFPDYSVYSSPVAFRNDKGMPEIRTSVQVQNRSPEKTIQRSLEFIFFCDYCKKMHIFRK